MIATLADIEIQIDQLSNQLESGALPDREAQAAIEQLESDCIKIPVFGNEMETKSDLLQKISNLFSLRNT